MSISKKIRFEVFKRDNFKCQYCGKEAPDVILEVDHIDPKSGGGSDDILNLITSCFDCNRGKSNIKLDDNSEIKKQKTELKNLNKKREQLEFLSKWRKQLLSLSEEEVQLIEDIFIERIGITFTETGKKKIKLLIKKYGLKETLEVADISIDQYFNIDDNSSIQKCFNYL